MTETRVEKAVEQTRDEVSGVRARIAAFRAAHPWAEHAVQAWGLLGRNHGNQYAAAITYFSFLALFPLLLLAVSVTGFVLHYQPGLEQDFFASLTRNVPGKLGDALDSSLHTAIDQRTSLGIVGLLGVFLAGSAWIGNLREAVDGVWGRPPQQRNFVMQRLVNLVVLGGLGLGLLTSVALTAVGTSLTDQILSAVGLDHLPGATAVLKILGIAIAAAADSVIFWWVLVKLPAQDVPRRVSVQGAVMASVGFEILKIAGTVIIAHATKSATAGPFGSLLAVLIWIQLVARVMLFTCAWMATAVNPPNAASTAALHRGPAEPEPVVADAPSPAAVGAALVGVGAAAGMAAGWALRRPTGVRHRVARKARARARRRARRRAPKVSAQPW